MNPHLPSSTPRSTNAVKPHPVWLRACLSVAMRIGHTVGLAERMPTPDRVMLEDVILLHYAQRADIHRVLFIGCDWYTRHCERMFDHAEYWTLERDPRRRRHGARRHVVDSMEHMGRHFAPRSLDLIVCNGVFGWGLNAKPQCEAAFDACAQALRDGGEFVLGFNDVPRYKPFEPSTLDAFDAFEPASIAPLDREHRVLVPGTNRHTYEFWRRRERIEPIGDATFDATTNRSRPHAH